MGNDYDDVLELLETKRRALEQEMTRLNTVIAALRNTSFAPVDATSRVGGMISPIKDICNYLTEMARPVHQNEIIRAVGELRQSRYPSLTNHYSNVWRALEYHVRHGRLISCVDPRNGQEVELKPLSERPKARKLPNAPEIYEADNWFALREESVGKKPDAPAIARALKETRLD